MNFIFRGNSSKRPAKAGMLILGGINE